MSTQEQKINTFKVAIAELKHDDPPEKKKMVFETVKSLWQEVGTNPGIVKDICQRLGISREMFNICVDDPSLIYGVENLSIYVNGGWLRDYLDYTTSHEGPEEFQLWVALTTMSAAIRWNAILSYAKFKVYTNLYTILVSPPATCRKTTTCNIGISLLREGSDCKIIKDKITPERMCALLAKLKRSRPSERGGIVVEETASQCLVYAPELTVFLGNQSYMEGLAMFLTSIYDCDESWEYETNKSKTIALKNHYISFLACTTPTELPRAITTLTTEGGLISRTNIIYKTKTPRSFPIPLTSTSHENALRSKLVHGLETMSHMEPIPFGLSTEGARWYTAWYDGWKQAMESGDSRLGFAKRNDVFIFKLAMLLSISEDLGPDIEAETLERASNILASANESMKILLGSIGTDSHYDRPDVATKIMNCIDKEGGTISRARLLKLMYQRRLLVKDITPTLIAMGQANLIQEFYHGKRGQSFFMKVRKFEDDEL